MIEGNNYGITILDEDSADGFDNGLITNQVSKFYAGELSWQSGLDASSRGYQQGWGDHECDPKFTTFTELFDKLENDMATPNRGIHITLACGNYAELETLVESISSQIPKYAQKAISLHPEHISRREDFGFTMTIRYDRPDHRMGDFNEAGIKRFSKILPLLREYLED